MDAVCKKRLVFWSLAVTLILLTLASRICIAYFLANDAPGDGVVYAQLARNLLEQAVFSTASEAPFSPTLIRLPGYPVFLAGVYGLFGHDNNTAVRIVQAVVDTGTCVLIAILAGLWTGDDERKRRNAVIAFVLASLCPFIVIYTATILTETLTTFLMAAMTVTATLALEAERRGLSLAFWVLTGLIAGAAVLLRPDSGLFAAGLGLTLVISEVFISQGSDDRSFAKRVLRAAYKGSVFSVAFILVLAPWTIRNYRLFGVFQPLAPQHAEMPGEFVPLGYFRWVRTWVDDSRYTEPMLWNLGDKPIRIGKIPKQAFDSPEERDQVAALLQMYNHPPGSEDQPPKADEDTSDENDNSDDNADDNSNSSDTNDQADENTGDPADDPSDTRGDDDDDIDEDRTYDVKMTPEISEAFGQIADARIARSRVRSYVFIPAKRAAALWFDSHSLYYPFGGQMSPVSDLDYDVSQQYWLPAFTLLMWIYTLLAIAGAVRLWRERANRDGLRWLILVALMTLPRIIFFSTMENPEPRYVVELFAFCSILGAFYISGPRFKNAGVEDVSEVPPASNRLLSLDAFRGVTIAAMVLVNEPGTWSAIYPQLKHAEWNGATVTDLIFPFFLFIVGVSIAFAFKVEASKPRLHYKIIKRAVILFALGLLLEIFPFYNIWTGLWFDPGTTRIMGVLQRIAICYLFAGIIFLHTGWKCQVAIAAGILLVYWALMTLINVPGCDITSIGDRVCNLSAYIDRTVLTEAHIWDQSHVFDPEGLLSTLPAIATTLAGVLTGQWLRSYRSPEKKAQSMAVSGVGLAAIGWLWSLSFPLSKSLWTSSYVVYTAGIALIVLAACYYLIDLKGYQRWAKPFLIFGTNAIALYVGSTVLGKFLDLAEIAAPNDQTISLQARIFQAWFLPFASPVNASLLYGIAFVLVWLFLMWLLYRKRIVVKV